MYYISMTYACHIIHDKLLKNYMSYRVVWEWSMAEYGKRSHDAIKFQEITIRIQ